MSVDILLAMRNIRHQFVQLFRLAFLLFSFGLLLSGCTTGNGAYAQYASTSNMPISEARNRYTNPSTYIVAGKRYHVLKSAKGYDKVGYASWYGKKFHGKRTFNNERYNMYGMTAASTTLPIPSYVRVTNLKNGHSAIVKINDRGPFKSNRIIDLSYAAAKQLGYTGSGTALVRVTAVDTSTVRKAFSRPSKHIQHIEALANDVEAAKIKSTLTQ